MKMRSFLSAVASHLMVGLWTVGLVTMIPSALYYAWAFYAGMTEGDFGGPANFIIIPFLAFFLGLVIALFITVPASVLIDIFSKK